MSTTTYGASPIKRFRRSKAQVEQLKADLYEIAKDGKPCTVRNVFYRAVSHGLVDKTELEYKAVGRFLVQMRRDGELPYSWLADHTRWRHKPESYSSLEDMLDRQQRLYRRSIWEAQPKYLEFWCEKDAIIGVLYPETSKWDIPLLPCRGYPSLTFLSEAADEIRDQDKPTVIFYAGDWDPSGCHISKKVEEELRGFLPEVELEFCRIAINQEDIALYNLPTRPTKKSDSRSRGFEGESVEIDAMDPNDLRDLCRCVIEANIDREILEGTERIEEAERDTLAAMIDGMGGEQ